SGGASGGGSGGARLERSVALALASLSDDPYEQRWLLLLGDAHDGREQGGLPDPDALGAAEALGAFRAGDAERLRRLLARSGVSAALGGLAHRVPGLAPLVARMGEVAPCPSCRGRLLVREKPGLNEPLTLCPICGGNPGPALSPEELLVTLRAEDLLLSPPHEGWASQVLLDAGAPVPEGQAMDFARHFRVDPTKVRFVPAADADDPLAGEWTRPPEPGAE
ncbi:MAG TPA: hypothetical protein DEB06_04965, partial [Phycisphaerales bacterium]|nr:hypothetical protein [Phycisphaerales bacterium]